MVSCPFGKYPIMGYLDHVAVLLLTPSGISWLFNKGYPTTLIVSCSLVKEVGTNAEHSKANLKVGK